MKANKLHWGDSLWGRGVFGVRCLFGSVFMGGVGWGECMASTPQTGAKYTSKHYFHFFVCFQDKILILEYKRQRWKLMLVWSNLPLTTGSPHYCWIMSGKIKKRTICMMCSICKSKYLTKLKYLRVIGVSIFIHYS